MSDTDSKNLSDSEKSKKSTNTDTDTDTDTKSNTSQVQVSKKDEINKIVKKYIKIDDLIKEKTELNKEKKELENVILDYLKNKKMDTITIDNIIIKRVEKDKKEPLNKKDIKQKLLDDLKKEGFVKNDGVVKSHTDGNQFIQTMLEAMEKRPITKIHKLERKGLKS